MPGPVTDTKKTANNEISKDMGAVNENTETRGKVSQYFRTMSSSHDPWDSLTCFFAKEWNSKNEDFFKYYQSYLHTPEEEGHLHALEEKGRSLGESRSAWNGGARSANSKDLKGFLKDHPADQANLREVLRKLRNSCSEETSPRGSLEGNCDLKDTSSPEKSSPHFRKYLDKK